MAQHAIDLIVTYVDCQEQVWQQLVAQYRKDVIANQFRSWNNLQYWFRGVEKFMPWVRTVHLVVSNIGQVPAWLDQDKVHVVLHKDIIPERLLPTFNSTTIEMFLHKIPGLAERFIYSNDDMFAVGDIDVEYFFKDGIPAYGVNYATEVLSGFKFQCKKSCELARKLSGKDAEPQYFYPKHSMTPMLKSIYEEVHSKARAEIISKCSKFRAPVNYTQYLFPDYAILVGKGIVESKQFIYVGAHDIDAAIKALESGKQKIICINDNAQVKNVDASKAALAHAFNAFFPEKSIFEK